ncbi:MAG: hypothetical protein ACXW08_17700 [Solirubrobacteraceae bacterium]
MASSRAELADEMEDSWRAAAGWLDRALERGAGWSAKPAPASR